MQDETGLNYICQTYERFSHVAMILVCSLNALRLFTTNLRRLPWQGKMVLQLAKEQSARLLKHVIRCYSRLSDNPRLARPSPPFSAPLHDGDDGGLKGA